MLERLAVRPHICRHIRSGPLGPWIEDFLLALTTNGYATSVIRRHVRAAVVFGDWLVRHQIAVADIDERVVAQFWVLGRAGGRRHVGMGVCRQWPAVCAPWRRISGRTRSPVLALPSNPNPSWGNGCVDLTRIWNTSAERRPGRGESIVGTRGGCSGRRWW